MWLVTLAGGTAEAQPAPHYDVVVYGATSAGVIAAVQSARLHKSVVLIATDPHLGGLTSGGLGWTDVGDPNIVGGLSREFYHRIYQYYQDEAHWTYGSKAQFANAPAQRTKAVDANNQVMWVFEPKAASQVLEDMLVEAKVAILKNERLDLKARIVKQADCLQTIPLESGRTVAGDIFIDASYEGDLMAHTGVTYTVGRESNDVYGETANGIQVAKARKNQVPDGIDPYVVKGDPSSGLLPGVNESVGGVDGTGDEKIQAYCYRMCLTDVPENRIPIEKPAGYDPLDYELLFRSIEAGQTDGFLKLDLMPNRKTDSNNASGVSTDLVGFNYSFPEDDYARREQFAKRQERWQRGLIWSLQNSERVPETIRRKLRNWGLAKDEFEASDHWPSQLYIREARRMKGLVVATEHELMNNTFEHSVGMGIYSIDSHAVQRYVDSTGHVRNEGDVQVRLTHPYRIDYSCIVPKRGECANLIVPVCLSASHVAYGSIRMEPVFMVLGQSAADAACIALDHHQAVQDVAYDELARQLLDEKQVLSR